MFSKATEAILSREVVDGWAVPVGLVAMQTLPVHIMLSVANMYYDAAIKKKSQHILLLERSEKWRRWYYSMHVESLLVLNCTAQGMTLKKSTIPHTDSWSGLFFA